MTIIKNEEDKKEFIALISEAFQEVMVPALEGMEERLKTELASKKDLEDVKIDLGEKIDALERKFDAQQDRLDRHNERIENLEKIHPQYKHCALV